MPAPTTEHQHHFDVFASPPSALPIAQEARCRRGVSAFSFFLLMSFFFCFSFFSDRLLSFLTVCGYMPVCSFTALFVYFDMTAYDIYNIFAADDC